MVTIQDGITFSPSVRSTQALEPTACTLLDLATDDCTIKVDDCTIKVDDTSCYWLGLNTTCKITISICIPEGGPGPFANAHETPEQADAMPIMVRLIVWR